MLTFLRKLSQIAREQCWGIGFIEMPLCDIVTEKKPKVKWVKTGYSDRWFADPFILDADDKTITLLVEELLYAKPIGRLARLSIDRQTMRVTDMKIILELDTHLSFPYIIRTSDKIYIMPENFNSGKQQVYELDPVSETLINPATIYSGQLTDANLISASNGKTYVLSTEEPDPNGRNLKIFEMCEGELLQISEFSFPSNVARNAGAFFSINGSLYRPAQVCDKCYGSAIEIQQVDLSNPQKPNFTTIKRIEPFCWRWAEGTHTLNSFNDNLIVVDGHGYRYPLLGKAVEAVASLVRKRK